MPKPTVMERANNARILLTRPVKFHIPPVHELHHKGEHFFHCSYLLLVGVESHYWYGKVALILFAWIVVPIFIKPATPHGGHAPTEAVVEHREEAAEEVVA